jgi:hypothetical protein
MPLFLLFNCTESRVEDVLDAFLVSDPKIRQTPICFHMERALTLTRSVLYSRAVPFPQTPSNSHLPEALDYGGIDEGAWVLL